MKRPVRALQAWTGGWAGAALCALALLPPAQAQTTPPAPPKPAAPAKPAKKAPAAASAPSGTLGAGTSGGPLLTRDELRTCMRNQTTLRERRIGLEARLVEMEREKGDLTAAGDALKAALETLDRTSPEAVEAYNQKARERDALVSGWNGRNLSLVADADAFKGEQAQWESACGNRRYREDDEIAIRRGQ